MELYEMICKRRSVRKYKPEAVDRAAVQKITDFCTQLKPLYADISVRAEIVDRENVKCILPWTTRQVVAIFSEEKEGFLENAGFMFQQLDLYMQSIGLGTCWLGMGRLDSDAKSREKDGLSFVIMLAFGYPREPLRSDITQFKRRSLTEISDRKDERLEPARLAPSSVNSQPWYFTHEDETVHVYCAAHGFFRVKTLSDMNRVDVGIALAHMYAANPDTFRFFRAGNVESLKNYGYIGSFTLSQNAE